MKTTPSRKKALARFFATRKAYGAFCSAAYRLMPHIYTEKMAERIAYGSDWLEVVGRDATAVLVAQHEAAGKP